MKKVFMLTMAMVIVLLMASVVLAQNSEIPGEIHCCDPGNQCEVSLINGGMLAVTFEVKVPGVYEFTYVIKNLRGIPIASGREIVVYDCTYRRTTVYIHINSDALRPYVNYLVLVRETVTVAEQEDELYFPTP